MNGRGIFTDESRVGVVVRSCIFWVVCELEKRFFLSLN